MGTIGAANAGMAKVIRNVTATRHLKTLTFVVYVACLHGAFLFYYATLVESPRRNAICDEVIDHRGIGEG